MKLQSLKHRDFPYERPDRTWVCGRKREGEPCFKGPNHRGVCPGGFACQPKMKGYRYLCARSSPAGGPCEKGPNPDGTCCLPNPVCQPELSMRAKRGRLVWGAIATTLLAFVVIMAAGFGLAFISPGPLSSVHADIESNCQSCHSTMDGGFQAALLNGLNSNAIHDGQKCLRCHDLGTHSFAVHSLSDQFLSQEPETRWRGTKHAKLACATCHVDHRGRQHDPRDVSETTCDACHQTKIDDFNSDHPSFTDYPYSEFTSVAFDHVLHENKHFPEQSTPFDCLSCHQTIDSGAMGTITFDKSCVSCHAQDIKGLSQSGEPGLLVWSAPGLDIETLEEKGFNVGDWPPYSDLTMSPFQRSMVDVSEEDLKVWVSIDLLDLLDADDEELKAIQRVALKIKKTTFDIQQQGHLAFRNGPNTLDPTFFGGLPEASFKEAAADWFPRLESEMELWKQGKQLPAAAPVPANKTAKSDIAKPLENDSILGGDDLGDLLSDDLLGDSDLSDDILGGDLLDPDLSNVTETNQSPAPAQSSDWVAEGGWYQRNEGLYYRPAVHRDLFIKSWLELLAHDRDPKSLKKLFSEKSPGACIKCHGVRESENGSQITWQPKTKKTTHALTHFDHGPHVGGSALACATCHITDPDSEFLDSFYTTDDKRLSNFAPVNIDTCKGCHEPGGVRRSCLTCHAYHDKTDVKWAAGQPLPTAAPQ